MTDPLDFHFSESLDELGAKLVGACDDSDVGNAEAQNDFPVQALDLEQADIGRTQSLAEPGRETVWILRPVNWDLGSPDQFAQGRARYAFCPLCLQEMISGTRTVWIRSECIGVPDRLRATPHSAV